MSGTCLFRMKASTLLLVMMKERSCVIIQVRFEWLMKTLSLSLFPLFKALQSGDLLKNDHDGGCVLYEKRRQVEELLSNS